MIQITEYAAKKIKILREEENLSSEHHLRVKVEKGGCSGFNYKLDFDKIRLESDQSIQAFETEIVIDPDSLLYLMGMTLDYEGGLNGQGFVFSNPNAKVTCSCGSSFGI